MDVQREEIAYVCPAEPVIRVLSTDKWGEVEPPVRSYHWCCMQPIVWAVAERHRYSVTIRLWFNRGLAKDL